MMEVETKPVYTNRITAEEVTSAFASTNMTPKQGAYISEDLTCACGLGAIYASKQDSEELKHLHDPTDSLIITRQLHNTYGMAYCVGFVKGFDGVDPDESYTAHLGEEETKRNNLGYEDGQAAWQALNSDKGE